MHEYATTERQHDFINEIYMHIHSFIEKKMFKIESNTLAPYLDIEPSVLKFIIETNLQYNTEYKSLYKGRKIKLSYYGIIKLIECINTQQAQEVKRYLHDIFRAYCDVLQEM